MTTDAIQNLTLELSESEYEAAFNCDGYFTHPHIVPFLERTTGFADLVDGKLSDVVNALVDGRLSDVVNALQGVGIEAECLYLDSMLCGDTREYSDYFGEYEHGGINAMLLTNWDPSRVYNEFLEYEGGACFHLIATWDTEDGPCSLMGRITPLVA